jgi:hypothetical protein
MQEYKFHYDDSKHTEECFVKKSIEVVTLMDFNHKQKVKELQDKIQEAEFLTQIAIERRRHLNSLIAKKRFKRRKNMVMQEENKFFIISAINFYIINSF